MAEELLRIPPQSDAELITAVRAGDTRAYEELYRRHVDAAMAVARHLTGSKASAEDVASEAFTRVLGALQRGAGPEMAFRPYLLTSVRNAFYDRTRKDKRVDVTDDVPEDLGQVLAAAGRSEEDFERQMAARAFASLPERWQLVLWHTEVEGMTPAEVAPLLGLAPNAVAALAYRAREGLRQAYLNAHVQAPLPERCAEFVPKLGAYVRDDLSNRDRAKVEDHLADCERCRAIVLELQEASSHLRIALIPIVAGIPAAAYLGGIGTGAGGLAAWGWRVGKRFKELGPGGQVATAVAAAAMAGALVVGAVAVGQNLGRGGRGETVTEPGASGGTSHGGGNGVGGRPPGTRPTATAAPGPSAAPPTATPTVPISAPAVTLPTTVSTSPGAATTTSPTTSAGTSGTISPTTAPGSTTGPTTPTSTTPTTVPSGALLRVDLTSAGPAYAGASAAIPVSVANGAAPAASSGFGRSLRLVSAAAPTSHPTFVLPLPAGTSFDSIDNPAWVCTVGTTDPTTLSCVLPALAGGAVASAVIEVAIDPSAPGSITLQPSISDAGGQPISGTPLVITVQPKPPGIGELVVDRADVALVGNAVLTCDPGIAASHCATARDDPAAAPGHSDKNQQHLIWLDVDADSTTFNSSTATLALPPGAVVLAAHLFWGGTVPGKNDSPADPKDIGKVQLMAPGVGPVAVTTIAISFDPIAHTRYVAVADATTAVLHGGAGTYTLTDVRVATGNNTFGGWALQVLYRDPAAPLRLVALGLADNIVTLNQGESAAYSLPGLTASPEPRAGKLSFAAFEGDYGLVPEAVSFNDRVLSNTGNAADNPVNGSITTPGAREPAYVNNFGFDADQFAVELAPDETEADVGISTTHDRARFAGIGISIPV